MAMQSRDSLAETQADAAARRFRALDAALVEAEAAVERIADARAAVAGELHTAGASYAQIATALDISRSRAQQLVERHRRVRGSVDGVAVADLPEPERVDADIEAAIRRAHAQIMDRPAFRRAFQRSSLRYVRLADVRAQLGDVYERAAVDRVLDKMIERPDVRLTAELDQRKLTASDRAAEVMIADEPRHLLSIDLPHPHAHLTAADAG